MVSVCPLHPSLPPPYDNAEADHIELLPPLLLQPFPVFCLPPLLFVWWPWNVDDELFELEDDDEV